MSFGKLAYIKDKDIKLHLSIYEFFHVNEKNEKNNTKFDVPHIHCPYK